MRCYYQGALQVTGGNINDVERTAMAYIEKWVYVEGSQENSGTLEPAEPLVRSLRHELQEGNYGNQADIISDRLSEYFGFDGAECGKVNSLLNTWGSDEVKENL